MLTMSNEAVDFLSDVDQITDVSALKDKFSRGIDQYGLSSYICSGSLRNAKRLEYQVMANALPDGFLEAFQKHAVPDNPSSELLMTSNKPFIWSQLYMTLGTSVPRFKETVAVANDFGLSDGICVPVHHPGGYVGALGMAGPVTQINKHAAYILQLMSIHFHDRLRELLDAEQNVADGPGKKRSKSRGQNGCELSPRERECVSWVAEGKTDWDIGEILGISQSTAHFHVENAKKKLDVATRVQLVVKAISKGYISV